MSFGNCKNCNAEFKTYYEELTAREYGGFCNECAMASPEHNPYGYHMYEPLEVRREKYNKAMQRSV